MIRTITSLSKKQNETCYNKSFPKKKKKSSVYISIYLETVLRTKTVFKKKIEVFPTCVFLNNF